MARREDRVSGTRNAFTGDANPGCQAVDRGEYPRPSGRMTGRR